jgi:proline dehydrogenase
MLRSVFLAAAHNPALERAVTHAPVSRSMVRRFVGGPDVSSAIGAASMLVDRGLLVTLEHLGEDATDPAGAHAVTDAYLRLLDALHNAGLTERLGPLTPRAEVSVKLGAVGQGLRDGDQLALAQARRICEAARAVGATVTLDRQDHASTDATLATLTELRADFPDTGAVLPARLRRTEGDCRDLAAAGSRIRLCKGADEEADAVAFRDRDEVDLSYVRCMNILLAGQGYPMWATHDARLIEIARVRAISMNRRPDSYEFQMLYGVRPDEQRRLAAAGQTVRVHLPYGPQWYGYLVRRLAERPANVGFFLRSMVTKG